MKPIFQTYSPEDVSELFGIPKSTILSAVKTNELPAIRYNQRVFRISAIDAAAWFATKGGRLKSTTSTTPTTSNVA